VIVVDTSALVAIHQLESDAARLHQRIARDEHALVPATVLVEFALLRKLGPKRTEWLHDFLRDVDVKTESISFEIAAVAADAAERYGRGANHPARLNFGDCLSYAVAKHLDAPLLYKGDDFIHTDIESAIPA
jgi:ribonuclease VapC